MSCWAMYGIMASDNTVLCVIAGNCDMFKSVQDCGNGSVFCGWSTSKNQCISTIEASVDTSYNCRRGKVCL